MLTSPIPDGLAFTMETSVYNEESIAEEKVSWFLPNKHCLSPSQPNLDSLEGLSIRGVGHIEEEIMFYQLRVMETLELMTAYWQ